jgi:hypothetical protein
MLASEACGASAKVALALQVIPNEVRDLANYSRFGDL